MAQPLLVGVPSNFDHFVVVGCRDRRHICIGSVSANGQLLLRLFDFRAGLLDTAFNEFGLHFGFPKDADPDIPILKQAKAEYAKLY